jgi:hypothetical protein
MYMRLENVISQVEHNLESGLKKRFACSHCGKTWVEIVGVFAGNIDGQEDMYFHVGGESEVCQNCKFNIRSCPECGSKDAYEVNFPLNNTQNKPLGFDRIRIISKT